MKIVPRKKLLILWNQSSFFNEEKNSLSKVHKLLYVFIYFIFFWEVLERLLKSTCKQMAKEKRKKMTNHFKSWHLSLLFKWLPFDRDTEFGKNKHCILLAQVFECGMEKCTTLKSNPFFPENWIETTWWINWFICDMHYVYWLGTVFMIHSQICLSFCDLSGSCSNGICQYAILSKILLKPEFFFPDRRFLCQLKYTGKRVQHWMDFVCWCINWIRQSHNDFKQNNQKNK